MDKNTAIGLGVGAVTLAAIVALALNQSSASAGDGGGGNTIHKFNVGDRVWVGTQPETDVIYQIVAVHLDARTYDWAQVFMGQLQAVQYGQSIDVIDSIYELYTGE